MLGGPRATVPEGVLIDLDEEYEVTSELQLAVSSLIISLSFQD